MKHIISISFLVLFFCQCNIIKLQKNNLLTDSKPELQQCSSSLAYEQELDSLYNSIDSDWRQDSLFEMRAKYSSSRKFNEYCKHQYLGCKLNPPPPPPPPSPILKKYFNIPKDVRLKMYPFNEYDSISIHLIGDSRTIILDKLHKSILSDIVFNYAYNGIEDISYYEPAHTKAVIKFYNTLNGTNRFVETSFGGRVNTNFTEYEHSQFDIDQGKFELFLKKTNKIIYNNTIKTKQ